MTNWICDELWDTCVLRYCKYWIMSYELCNHTIVRPFKGDQFLRDKYCDRIHYGNLTSWITLWGDELKWFWKQLSSCVYWIVRRKVYVCVMYILILCDVYIIHEMQWHVSLELYHCDWHWVYVINCVCIEL